MLTSAPSGHSVKTRREVLEFLVSQAVLAPSGDNLQPWMFLIDDLRGRVGLCVDPKRDRTPMNRDQRMSRIAIGAGIENIVRTAAANRLGPIVDYDEGSGTVWTTCKIDAMPSALVKVEAIQGRHTNRKTYSGQAVTEDVASALEKSCPQDNCTKTNWLFDRKKIEQVAKELTRADAILFNLAAMRNAFLQSVRFDLAYDQSPDFGLSPACLELRRHQAFALRFLRAIPTGLAQNLRVGNSFAAQTRSRVESSSGLCTITTTHDLGRSDVAIGRAVQKAWLTMTELGLVAQPMMSAIILEQSGVSGLCYQELNELLTGSRDANCVFLMRFGHAAAPAGITSRLKPHMKDGGNPGSG